MIDEYECYLRDDKGNKPKSYRETVRRLHRFFTDADELVHAVTPKRAQELYDKLAGALAVDSHRNYLAEAKTFWRWCVGKRYARTHVLERVTGVGRRRHGKEQLGIDEARAWLAAGLGRAANGNAGAVGALVSLLLGLRASEVVKRRVRDVDDKGFLLWIRESKTDAGIRQVEVPEILRPYLLAQAQGKGPLEPLFPARGGGFHDRDWVRAWVQRICREAGVPKVTAHSMRGLHGTLARSRGATGELVAQALGHESKATTEQSYITPEATERAKQRAALEVLQGGRG